MRNPKDMIISLYNFAQNMKNDKFSGTAEELINMFIEDEAVFVFKQNIKKILIYFEHIF